MKYQGELWRISKNANSVIKKFSRKIK